MGEWRLVLGITRLRSRKGGDGAGAPQAEAAALGVARELERRALRRGARRRGVPSGGHVHGGVREREARHYFTGSTTLCHGQCSISTGAFSVSVTRLGAVPAAAAMSKNSTAHSSVQAWPRSPRRRRRRSRTLSRARTPRRPTSLDNDRRRVRRLFLRLVNPLRRVGCERCATGAADGKVPVRRKEGVRGIAPLGGDGIFLTTTKMR
uniref:Uncharacterized protein n=1 Tax=Arundo donax TaxID=35708 RepID=A0A0A9DQY5_ARUDO